MEARGYSPSLISASYTTRRDTILVLWWVDANVIPEWKDGVERLEDLHDNGPSAVAFSFKYPYGRDGEPAEIHRGRVKEIAALNAAGQGDLLTHVMTLKI